MHASLLFPHRLHDRWNPLFLYVRFLSLLFSMCVLSSDYSAKPCLNFFIGEKTAKSNQEYFIHHSNMENQSFFFFFCRYDHRILSIVTFFSLCVEKSSFFFSTFLFFCHLSSFVHPETIIKLVIASEKEI